MNNSEFEDPICERLELCRKGEDPFLIHEFPYSYFVIGDHQFYQGYSQLLFKKHVREIHELSDEENCGLARELAIAGKAINDTFSPWKLNYQCIGNMVQHIHWHILPRYESDPYHKSLPFTDIAMGKEDLSNYSINSDEARKLVIKVKENL